MCALLLASFGIVRLNITWTVRISGTVLSGGGGAETVFSPVSLYLLSLPVPWGSRGKVSMNQHGNKEEEKRSRKEGQKFA